MMGMSKIFHFALLGGLVVTVLIQAQDQSGFISIDCGAPADSSYTEKTTSINYISDAKFINTGVNKAVTTELKSYYQQQMWNVRSFPEGIRNCYTINITSGSKYLIRATFLYGNYDGKNELPEFDLLLGANLWDTVKIKDASFDQYNEIIHIPSRDYIQICLADTSSGTPFISAIELRTLNNDAYVTDFGSLSLYLRWDLGSTSNQTYRYDYDVYDRFWDPKGDDNAWTQLSASIPAGSLSQNDYQPPEIVMNTAATPVNSSEPMLISWEPEDESEQFYVYMHFTELEVLKKNQTREFNITQNGEPWYENFVPPYQSTFTIYSQSSTSGEKIEYSFVKTENSTHPPIINAIEIFSVKGHGSLSPSFGGNRNLCSSGSCNERNGNKVVVPLVASIGGAVMILAAAVTSFCILKRRQRVPPHLSKLDAYSRIKEELESYKRQFSYDEVLSITKNFERVVGKGASGTVYHGYTGDNQVAVKMLSPSSVHGYMQFQAEAKLLAKVHHKCLTALIGYCDDGTNMALIYEYMASGDLAKHLSDKNENIFSWQQRLQIAVDAAEGLEYLHHGCTPPIVHRDIKSKNILLTENFRGKLADFGLSKIFPDEGDTHMSTVIAGTPGYLDPEYNRSKRLREKSDVFSFGVVLLEIITGQTAITKTEEKTHIIQWVGSMLIEREVNDIVDSRLRGEFDIDSAKKVLDTAMACVAPTSINRPTMSHVVVELKQCLATEMIQPSESHSDESLSDSINIVSFDRISGESSLER